VASDKAGEMKEVRFISVENVGQTFLFALLLMVSVVAGLSACAGATPTPLLTPLTVQLSWTHQAQFAGFYAADHNGDYAAAGLDVTFIEGGPDTQTATSVLGRAAQFGVAGADQILLWRADGRPIRAIATIYRHSPRVYITLADSGITRPEEFTGQVISVGRNGRSLLDAMMIYIGIDPDQYTVVESQPDLAQFYSGEVQVRSVFLTNEVITAQAAGYQLHIIYPDDYGIHFYGDTIFTTDELITTQPDLVKRFLQASLKGWTYAVENPAEVGPLVVKLNPQADPALEIEKMTTSLPLINTGEDYLGWMRSEVWAGMEQTLRSQSVLTRPVQVTDTYTLQFLQEIYDK
jgi:NitT/TauT family transport system substrate-binding protein